MFPNVEQEIWPRSFLRLCHTVAHADTLSTPNWGRSPRDPSMCPHLLGWSFPNCDLRRGGPHTQLPVSAGRTEGRGSVSVPHPSADYITECFGCCWYPSTLSLSTSLNFRLRPGMGFGHPAGHCIWLEFVHIVFIIFIFTALFLQLPSYQMHVIVIFCVDWVKMWFNYFKENIK